jgi:hypothetical protein
MYVLTFDHFSKQLISLHDFKIALESGAASLEEFEEKPMLIQQFSAGYKANGQALKAAPEALRAAQGLGPKRPLAIGDEEADSKLAIGGKEADSKLPARKKIRSRKAAKGQDGDVLALKPTPHPPNKENKLPPDVYIVDKVDAKPAARKRTCKPKTVGGQGDNALATLEDATPHADAESNALVVIGNETVDPEPPATKATRRSTRIRKTRQGNGESA